MFGFMGLFSLTLGAAALVYYFAVRYLSKFDDDQNDSR